jgi:hypothetical protein
MKECMASRTWVSCRREEAYLLVVKSPFSISPADEDLISSESLGASRILHLGRDAC